MSDASNVEQGRQDKLPRRECRQCGDDFPVEPGEVIYTDGHPPVWPDYCVVCRGRCAHG